MSLDLRKYENLHIALWLVKDTCWCMSFKLLGVVMIIPTLLVALHIVWRTRHEAIDLYHNIAICCWIAANATWMIGEFYYHDTLRPYALVCFAVGLLVVAWYYIVVARRGATDV
jgi:hypothetical protein